MQVSGSRPFSVYCLLSCGAALHGLGGCDPAEDWSGEGVGARSGDDYFVLGSGLDPIPGGGTCEECVIDAALSGIGNNMWRLDLCIDGGITYIGTSTNFNDDISLKTLLGQLPGPTNVGWQLVGTDEAMLCTSKGKPTCSFKKSILDGNQIRLSIEFGSKQTPPRPKLLRFHPTDATLSGGLFSPGMKIRGLDSGGFQCGAVPDANAKKMVVWEEPPGDMENALAHITAPFLYGGVRSCSGVLITPQYVLTAAHCFASEGVALSYIIDFSSTRVQFLGLGGLPSQSAIGVDSITLHPDPARDLALLRLQTPANVVQNPPIPIALVLPDNPGCTWMGRGFGRSDKLGGYDWGKGKAIPVRPLAPGDPVAANFLPEALAKILLLENADSEQYGLCRGDSGGPIVQTCFGHQTVVGIASARVFWSEFHDSDYQLWIEQMTSAFAFSYGNICGEGEVVAYAASRIDDEAQQWIHGVIGPNDLPVYF